MRVAFKRDSFHTPLTVHKETEARCKSSIKFHKTFYKKDGKITCFLIVRLIGHEVLK